VIIRNKKEVEKRGHHARHVPQKGKMKGEGSSIDREGKKLGSDIMADCKKGNTQLDGGERRD